MDPSQFQDANAVEIAELRINQDEAFELPLWFPEIVQHMEEACRDVFSTPNVLAGTREADYRRLLLEGCLTV